MCCLGVTTLLHLFSACCLTIALFAVPDKPFRVVWNHPDPCEQKGIHLALAEHGIVHNSDRRFLGDKIQTLFRHGEWPEINKDLTMVNGGLPQLWNDTTFAGTRADLMNNYIPNFTGLGVLDWEGWRAIFQANYASYYRYQEKSIEIVHERHPDWNTSAVLQQAEREWEDGARRVMSGKLAVAQELMPSGHWGYFMYPRIWEGDSIVRLNNRMEWLWRQSTGLYPSEYVSDPSKTSEYLTKIIWNVMAETLRIKDEFSPPEAVIYLYIFCNYNATSFYTLRYLQLFIGLPAEMGADGVVIWGNAALYKDPSACPVLQNYVHDVLGPYVQNLTRLLADCSVALCAGRGRCIHNARDVFMTEDKAVKLSAQCASRDSRFRDYHCRCYNAGDRDCCQTVTTVTTMSVTEQGSSGSTSSEVVLVLPGKEDVNSRPTGMEDVDGNYLFFILAPILALVSMAVCGFHIVWRRQGDQKPEKNEIQRDPHGELSPFNLHC